MAIVGEQRAAVARVLAVDDVGPGQHGQCAQGDVGEVADRRGDQIEAGRQRLGHAARADTSPARCRRCRDRGRSLLLLASRHLPPRLRRCAQLWASAHGRAPAENSAHWMRVCPGPAAVGGVLTHRMLPGTLRGRGSMARQRNAGWFAAGRGRLAAAFLCALLRCGLLDEWRDARDRSRIPAPRRQAEPGHRQGTGVKVALLVPLSAQGHAGLIGKSLKQAAELALFERDNPSLQLIVKDDKGTPEGAKAAAEEAIKGGAKLILGPLFAKSVTAVAPVARQAGVPVIAFSNDRQVAGNGVYLLSFQPAPEVDARRRLRRPAGQAPVCRADPAGRASARSSRRASRRPSAAPAARSWRMRDLPPSALGQRHARADAQDQRGDPGRRGGGGARRCAVPAGRTGEPGDHRAAAAAGRDRHATRSS